MSLGQAVFMKNSFLDSQIFLGFIQFWLLGGNNSS